ncbi:VanZ like family protein [Colwellia chukchiensis]|uniref:VanZ like family protein n=1 Tax=Colwellia chukchiensis TaxID=641665 RepID=A0A1H7GF90_9GAMM|nr:VanZ family protein [Colwellia chukchiensis]SEK36956.1 VanZ like family protein [Colwellia chukchiensis]
MLATLIQIVSRFWLAISLVILTLITAGSLFPADYLPPAPGSDKTHHFIGYCALMLPAAIRRPKYWLLLAVFFVAWSGAIELIQPHVNRYGEWLDLAANTCGVLIAIILSYAIRYFISPKDINLS